MSEASSRPGFLHRHRRALSLAGVALVVLAGVAIGAWASCGFEGCPAVETLAAYQPEGASLLLDRHGEPFAELAVLPGRRVALQELPSRVPQAFLAVEDQRFYEHEGIDLRRIGGALFANLRAGGTEEGGSTISMQLARNLFPERIPAARRTVGRKLLEIRVARAIEERFSKQEVLELYLNHIYFGNGAHGIEAASRHYFGHPASELTLPEAALLAALPKAPAHYDPRQHPEAARERRDLVLELMAEQGRVPPRQAEAAREAPLGVVSPPPADRDGPGAAPYFAQAVRRELDERFGNSLYTAPVRVWTTLDPRAQFAAEEALAAQLRAIESSNGGGGNGGDGPVQGAVVLLEVATGDVLAWVGGRDFEASEFDRVAHARRQPGSAFKPFVYAAALAEGYPLSAPLEDRPLALELPDGRTWRPANFRDDYDGRVSLRQALVASKNVPTVRLALALGTERVAQTASRLGLREPIPTEPSMALGTLSVSPLELAAAYGAFAGLGDRAEPRLVLRVERADGTPVWESEPRTSRRLEPAVAYLVTSALADAVDRGTGAGLRAAGLAGPAAGKTGTSDDGADAWFVGYTPRLLGAVWIGFDQPRSIAAQATGGGLAAPVLGRVLAEAGGAPAPPWPRPDGVVELPVDPATGLPLADGCRPAGRVATELFLADAVPEPHCPGRGAPPESALADRREPAAPEVPEPAEDPKEIDLAAGEPVRKAEREEERVAEREEERRAERRAERAAAREAEERRAERAAARREREAAEATAEERADERADERAEARADAAAPADLSGWWELETRIESSSVERYEGLRLAFRVLLDQDGTRVSGEGEKWAENGRRLGAGGRTPIRLSGTLDGRTLTLTFGERGARRASGGSLRLALAPDGRSLSGSFASDAASSRGSATLRRIP